MHHIMNKIVMVGPNKPAIPGQHCFELVSSHQQGIRMTCLAHMYIHTINLKLHTILGRHESVTSIGQID